MIAFKIDSPLFSRLILIIPFFFRCYLSFYLPCNSPLAYTTPNHTITSLCIPPVSSLYPRQKCVPCLPLPEIHAIPPHSSRRPPPTLLKMCDTTLITHQKCIVFPPSPVEACSPGSSQMIPQGRMAREPGRWPPARIGKGSPPACGAKQPVQGQARRIGLLDGTGANESYANLCSAPLRGTGNPLQPTAPQPMAPGPVPWPLAPRPLAPQPMAA